MPSRGPRDRTLYVSSFPPTLGNGRALRTYTVTRALAQLGPVDFAYVPFGAAEPDGAYAALPGIDFHVVRPSRGLRRLSRYAALKARGLPEPAARSASPELTDAADRLAEGRGRVVVGDMGAMVACLDLATRRPVIYNSHNVESSFRFGGDRSAPENRRLRNAERRILELADESWMVSRRDVVLARQLAPQATLRYVPNVVDVKAIRPVSEAPNAAPTVLMVGDYTYAPNAEGAAWLAGAVMPHVWRELPAARLRLVGRGASDAVEPSERVACPGFVEDLEAAYAEAAAVAVPLQDGGGSPLKFVEALAYAVPVVATSVAAQGLEVEPGRDFRLADDAPAFGAALVELARDGAPGMGRAARSLVEREYSVEALVRLIAA